MRAHNLYQSPSNSHKGQNGKLLVIGGSELFHSGIFWSADVASRIVDLVHLTSPANENNQIFRKKLKEKFWNGIVVDWSDVEEYIKEDDCILIGPGMVRREKSPVIPAKAGIYTNNLYRSRVTARDDNESGTTMKTAAKYDSTSFIVNYLLKKYPNKRWVIDGGALQEVDVELITDSCILTPHKKEFLNLLSKSSRGPAKRSRGDLVGIATSSRFRIGAPRNDEISLSKKLDSCTILLKGPIDIVCQGDRCVKISGGNPGMTKGGTGDVLAGLVAALYCKNDPWTASTIGSRVNKKAGDEFYKRTRHYFNAADLAAEVPKVLAKFAKPVASREVSQTSPLTIYGIMKENVPT